MKKLLERRFPVEATTDRAWEVIADPERWPVWARHLRSVRLDPPGPVGATSTALLVLTDGTRARVAVTEYVEGVRFRWDGGFLWMRLGYDHVIHDGGSGGSCEIEFTVWADGAGIGSIGRLFARVYARRLDRQIPRLRRLLADQPVVGHVTEVPS